MQQHHREDNPSHSHPLHQTPASQQGTETPTGFHHNHRKGKAPHHLEVQQQSNRTHHRERHENEMKWPNHRQKLPKRLQNQQIHHLGDHKGTQQRKEGSQPRFNG
ncbi:unnamed protein product [Prunus brigantina]